MKKGYRLSLSISVIILMLVSVLKVSYAQWPPFKFSLVPFYENGMVTYHVEFRKLTDWDMTNVTFKIPLPEGTRFVKASTIPTIDSDFDGKEVTFFLSALHHRIEQGDATFVLEVIGPNVKILTTHAWIAWQGDQPGDYLTPDVSIDTTKLPLNWEQPSPPRLQLVANATVADDVITYAIYPRNASWDRMWDLKINIPVPDGTTFLSAESPSPFVSSFDGREVSFQTSELEPWITFEPLTFKVSVEGVAGSFVVTHAWATWRNVGRDVGTSVVSQEEFRTGDLVVQPHTFQWVVSDTTGDVPFPNYDLTSVAFQNDGASLTVYFYTAENLGPVGEALDYILYVDSDCNYDSGGDRGGEYRLRYRHDLGVAVAYRWDEQEESWKYIDQIEANNPVGGKMIGMRVPYHFIGTPTEFCWQVEAKNNTKMSYPEPPFERVPNSVNLLATQFAVEAATAMTKSVPLTVEPLTDVFIDVGDIWRYMPGWAEPPSAWSRIGFDDSEWYSGPTGIGYGEGDYATDLSFITSTVQNNKPVSLVQRTITQTGVIVAVLPSAVDESVFMRRAFTVPDPTMLTQLMLEIEYEGGFIVYLNGVEVARRGLGAPNSPVSYDALATDHQSDTVEIIDLSDYITNLVVGTNVLAIQAHKSSISANLSITPKLTWAFNPGDILINTAAQDDSSAVTSVPSRTPLVVTNIKGKLAVPLDNGGAYDVHIFSLLADQEIARIPNARQPNFRFDGQRLLINREGGGIENVYEYNLVDGTEEQVSDAPQDWHPFYDPWGNRVVYGNSELTVGSPLPKIEDGEVLRHEKTGEILLYAPRPPFIFVQCGLLPPHQEVEPRCRDIPNLGVLVPAGQIGEIQGTHPVWTVEDNIVYHGCNTWAGSKLCGIYSVPSSSTKGFSDGFIPRQLTRDSNDTPSDTKGNLIAFTSIRDGDWEAYIMDLNGNGVKNLSNSPGSNDGLPTISPDGNRVAFVSDRGGQWAVWVVPVAGGAAQKLFDLPSNQPWGDGNRSWLNERISWGP